jgi:HAE1 family hydrophobic/amphiphilic exporter-1
LSKIANLPGVGNLILSIDLTKPEYHFVADRKKCADYGVSPSRAANTLRTMLLGQTPTEMEDDGFFYPVRILYDEKNLEGVEDLRNLILPFGNQGIPLQELGSIERKTGPVGINRKDQMRIVKVTGTVTKGDIGTVTKEVYSRLGDVELPAGAFIKAGGQAQAMRENNRAMLVVILLGIFFAFILLTIQFESIRMPVIVLSAIPFVLTGFIGALYIFGIPLGITAIIGIVVLLGMLINHWVLVLSFIEEKVQTGMDHTSAIVSATSLRLRPILMTFLTDVLGLMPFLLNIGEGTEMLRPLGVAVIGGITWSLAVTFVFVPIAYHVTKRR